MNQAYINHLIAQRNRWKIYLRAVMPEEHQTQIKISFALPENFETQINFSDTITEESEPHDTLCEFCGEIVNIERYDYHAKRCKSNPINIRAPCSFCEKEFPSDLATKHVIYCSQNPENIKSIHSQSQVKNIKPQLKEYKKQMVDDKSGGDCPICLCEIKKSDSVRFLSCLHKYHEKCIADWTKQNKNCPICRTSIP